MAALTASPVHHVAVGDRPCRANRCGQLVVAAGRFGQMDLCDPRWTVEERVLDQLLHEAVELSTSPRRAVWQTIAGDPATPLVVKLRTFAAVVGSLQPCERQ